MKKKFIVFCTALLCLGGCSQDILNTSPNDRYTEDLFWVSEKNASAGLMGCYSVLRRAGIYGGQATPLWEETATPNAYNYDNSMGFNVIANGTQTANNSGIINQRYADSYSGVGRCNMLLAKIDGITMDENLKQRMKGEATFLRALYYSLLATYYGGVPLILAPPSNDQIALPRNSREEIVEQVLKDLDVATLLLPAKYTGNDIGRATKGAALALKARVLLFEASPLNNPSGELDKWEKAAKAAKAVIDLSEAQYGLFSNYRSLFLPANENSVECIFDVQFKAPEQGTYFDAVGSEYTTNAPVRGLIDAYMMKDGRTQDQSPLYNPSKPYENRDPRMYQTLVYPGDVFKGTVTTATVPFKITGYALKKYTVYDKEPVSNVVNGGRSEINYMVLRYADILLMYAEAQNESLSVPDASVYDAVNAVRKRAGLNPYVVPAGQSKGQMRELIRQERRIEFVGEGYYYNDIRRWKLAEVVMNAPVFDSRSNLIESRRFNPQRDYWWPIPLYELDLNHNLEQNPNY